MHLRILRQSLMVGLMTVGIVSCTSKSANTENNATVDEPATEEKKTSARPTEWGYEGDRGPAQWGTLDPVYALCGTGKSQSPINLSEIEVIQVDSLKLNYATTPLKVAFNGHVDDIIDNGHTIQINAEPGSSFMFNNQEYHLKQFHFHTPTEHTIDGQNLPLEVHFVHQSDDNQLAVISVMMEEGEENPNIAPVIANLPTTKGEVKHLSDEILALNLHLPEDKSAYTYVGSLTTPPCSENVQWVVLKTHPTMSAEQIKAISDVIGKNNRPVQDLNGRGLNESTLSEASI